MHTSTRKHSKARTYAKAAISGCLTALALISVTLALACHGGKIAGVENAEVLSGSMEPAIATGSLAYFTTQVDCTSLEKGQVIAFQTNANTRVIHRVVRNDTAKELLYTKGDANKVDDPFPVAYEDVKGLVVFSVPFLGRLINGIHESLINVIPPALPDPSSLLPSLLASQEETSR